VSVSTSSGSLEVEPAARSIAVAMQRLTVAFLIAASVLATASTPSTASTASTAGAGPGTLPVWVARYRGVGEDVARSAAVSADGTTVYVTGGIQDYATVAYDAATGAQRWVARYDGPANWADASYAIAVNPVDSTVYVTGGSLTLDSSYDYATVAYDGATGAERWVARYDGPAGSSDEAVALGVSPDGGTVFVTGDSYAGASDLDYVTVAYAAATGEQLWEARYDGPGNWTDVALALAVSPDGLAVYVTGSSWSATDPDYATVGYAADSGTQLWVTRFNGPGNGEDDGSAVAVSPDNTAVYVTGGSWGLHDCFQLECIDYSTVAYATAGGAQLWVSEYDGPKNDYDYARSLAVSPDGASVYVTGDSWGQTSSDDYATLAYEATTGQTRWTARFNGPDNVVDVARSVAVSPDGALVFVTGESNESPTPASDYVTIAYDGNSGKARGRLRFRAGRFQNAAVAVLVAPDGSRVYVAGYAGPDPSQDYVTIAYSLS
jgi:hypothetical protein